MYDLTCCSPPPLALHSPIWLSLFPSAAPPPLPSSPPRLHHNLLLPDLLRSSLIATTCLRPSASTHLQKLGIISFLYRIWNCKFWLSSYTLHGCIGKKKFALWPKFEPTPSLNPRSAPVSSRKYNDDYFCFMVLTITLTISGPLTTQRNDKNKQ